jgi:hypothetical protein
MTTKRVEEQEKTMSDDNMRINANDRPEQTKPEAVNQQAEQSQASSAAQPRQSAAAGRRPLFRS